jgi:hypothetical protein
MIFDFDLEGKRYTMDLSLGLKIEIVRDMLKLHEDFCTANPANKVDFVAWLKLIEDKPHPESPPDSDDDDYIDENELVALVDALKRKDKIIEGLLKLVGDVK